MTSTALAALVLSASAFMINDIMTRRTTLLEHQTTVSRILGLNSMAALDFNDVKAAQETLNSLSVRKDVRAAAIYDVQGELFATYIANGTGKHPPPSLPPGPESRHRFLDNHLELFEPINHQGVRIGTVFLRTDLSILEEQVNRYLAIVCVILLVVGLASFILSSRLQRTISEPLKHLAELAQRVSRTRNYKLRAKKQSNDELGILADDFNEMLEEIQERDRKLEENAATLEAQVHARTADLEALAQQLEHQTKHDDLTGLPNRTLFEDRLQQAIYRCERGGHKVGVLVLDLERFKWVNDSLGHHAGDELLKQIAKRLRDNVRQMDTVARQGGDEFTILLMEIKGAEDARLVCDKLLNILRAAFKIGGHQIHVTGSIGYSLCPDHGTDLGKLLRNADVAMYAAKHQGGDQHQIFTREMRTGGAERLSLESQMRRALDRDEFEVHFQPQYTAERPRIVSFEALIRWRHEDWGMVSPSKFIPVAEESGLIADIDEWVLTRTAGVARQWQQEFGDIPIAVNMSSREFLRPHIVKRVADILDKMDCPHGLIELEITEGMVMHRAESVINMLTEFQRMGIGIAIDDFGTGYSSLSYLKRFPINKLKIDQSFVHDIPHDTYSVAICRAILAMAQGLRLKVIAEGVETEAQHHALRGLGCDLLQGFYFSKPLPEQDAYALLKRNIK